MGSRHLMGHAAAAGGQRSFHAQAQKCLKLDSVTSSSLFALVIGAG